MDTCGSRIYPHLCAFNQPRVGERDMTHGEVGIGAVVPWAGKLWYLTYPQHQRTGSNDKLYMVDEHLDLTIRPESVGGTHACRMIHRESNQLIIGPYFIDAAGHVRAAELQQLEGRLTAVARSHRPGEPGLLPRHGGQALRGQCPQLGRQTALQEAGAGLACQGCVHRSGPLHHGEQRRIRRRWGWQLRGHPGRRAGRK